MPGNDEVKLKLVLDVLGAQKEADGYVRNLNKIGETAEKIAAQMQNTVSGRLLGGLAGAVTSTLGRVFEQDLPRMLGEAELKIKAIEAAVGAVAGPKAAELVGSVVRKGYQGDIAASQGAFSQLQQLQSVFSDTPLSEEDVASVGPALYHHHRQIQATNRQLLENFDSVMQGEKVTFDSGRVATDVSRAVSSIPGAETALKALSAGGFDLNDRISKVWGG